MKLQKLLMTSIPSPGQILATKPRMKVLLLLLYVKFYWKTDRNEKVLVKKYLRKIKHL